MVAGQSGVADVGAGVRLRQWRVLLAQDHQTVGRRHGASGVGGGQLPGGLHDPRVPAGGPTHPPPPKGRKHHNRQGMQARNSHSRQNAKRESEPRWLVALPR